MDQPVAFSTNRLKVLQPMGAPMRPELTVMNLQQIGSAPSDAPPSVLIQNLAAVESVNKIRQHPKSNALFSMPCLCHQLVCKKRAIAEYAIAVRHGADFIASQHFCSSLCHSTVLLFGTGFLCWTRTAPVAKAEPAHRVV
jgi:hypothetical protein